MVSARTLRPWFTKGLESTFHTLKSIQHRASSITMSSQNEPNMVWKDKTGFTTLIYMGHEVSLNALRKCQGALEDETRTLLVDTLLFGHPFHVDIPSLCDDMGNKQAGYSLFTDRVNAEALGPIDQLADHILHTQSPRCALWRLSSPRHAAHSLESIIHFHPVNSVDRRGSHLSEAQENGQSSWSAQQDDRRD